MIITVWIAAILIAVVVGLVSDELLRGRDARSMYVSVAAAAGGVVGLILQRMTGENGALVGLLAAVVGALLLSFVTRVRISAAIPTG
jgi:uncharacterized membrane protein YeaQ/YmgE (transglycosylase-associated protein family)